MDSEKRLNLISTHTQLVFQLRQADITGDTETAEIIAAKIKEVEQELGINNN